MMPTRAIRFAADHSVTEHCRSRVAPFGFGFVRCASGNLLAAAAAFVCAGPVAAQPNLDLGISDVRSSAPKSPAVGATAALPSVAPKPGGLAGVVPATSQQSPPHQPDLIPFDVAQAYYRALSPPAGTPLAAVGTAGRSVASRLGASTVQRADAGRRLGGGADSPSPEALSIDPRDAFDAKVSALSDPKLVRGY